MANTRTRTTGDTGGTLKCDSCRQELTAIQDKLGRAWDCHTCGVRVVGLGRLRRESHGLAVRVKLRAERAERDGRRCCFCLDWLRAVDDSGTVFGVCRVCQTVTLPARYEPPSEQPKTLVRKPLELKEDDAREMRRALGAGHAGSVRRSEKIRRLELLQLVFFAPYRRAFPLLIPSLVTIVSAFFARHWLGWLD